MTTQSLKIVAGPSKFDIMVSLFEGNPSQRNMVTFHVLNGMRTAGPADKSLNMSQEMKVAITAVEQEDGSGESWNIAGVEIDYDSRRRRVARRVRGYYTSQRREGILEYVE